MSECYITEIYYALWLGCVEIFFNFSDDQVMYLFQVGTVQKRK